jgi:hypothetical protein
MAAALAAAAVISAPAKGLDVTFSGVVANTCSLALSTPGILALSSDGTKLGSDQIGGLGAIVLVVSIGSNTITVGTPAWTSQPSGYANSGEQMQVSYSGASGLSSINQGWGTTSTSFTVGMLVSATALTVHNRITNAAGFAQGTYQTKTVLTCS